MTCPKCGKGKTEVIDSRQSGQFGDSIYRRRACLECGQRFSTHELKDSQIRLMACMLDLRKMLIKVRKIENVMAKEFEAAPRTGPNRHG